MVTRISYITNANNIAVIFIDTICSYSAFKKKIQQSFGKKTIKPIVHGYIYKMKQKTAAWFIVTTLVYLTVASWEISTSFVI